jgi:hypothetical protein
MMSSARRLGIAALSLVAAACVKPVVVQPPPPIPIIPLTFEANLVTAQECEYVGPVTGRYDADGIGANLIIAFVFSRSSSTYNGVTQYSYTSMKGKGVKCPKEVVARLVAQSRVGESEDK